jgi:hypothetical protein
MHHHHHTGVRTESVVLDIGDDAGALVFYTDPALSGAEIEIAPLQDPAHKTHIEVLERVFNGRRQFSGVFPPLPVGEYHICRPAARAGQPLSISPGKVTQIDWRLTPR